MLLSERLARTGGFFFRWRSFMPLVFLPPVAVALTQAEPIERAAGEVVGGLYEAACIAMVVAGLAIRAVTVGFVARNTSGRKTRQVADSLNTTAMYSLTRNPLYLGNAITYLGVALFAQNLLVGLAFALFLVVYYERIIMAEEAYLLDRFGDAYAAWARGTPAFFPRLSGWRRPALPFSLKAVLRREHHGWLAAMLALAFVEIGGDAFGHEQQAWVEPAWMAAIAAVAAIYLTIHALKRWTSLLKVTDR